MAVRPESLETPELGMDLMTRHSLSEPEPADPEDEEDDAPALRDRIAAARQITPPDGEGCRDCWQHGRDAALGVIGSAVEADEARAAIESARVITPRPSELHWLDCWKHGRDAALRAIEGE